MKPKKVRWKGIVPLVLLLALIAVAWVLYLDTFVEHSIEDTGAEVVGARVDLASADVRLSEGTLRLSGLQVADPASPMRNLFEAGEIVASLAPRPLLQKKVIIDSVVVRGVKFGTPRTESGALENPSPTTGAIGRQVSAWASQVRLPAFSLEGLGSQVVNLPAISVDSLRTVQQAKQVATEADSLRRAWEAQLTALDPRPKIDTAQQVLARLKAADVKQLGVAGTRALLEDTRRTVNDLTATIDRTKALERSVAEGMADVKAGVRSLDDARLADYAYARSLVKLPSLDGPDISPALFGQAGLERLKPLLYWLQVAEKYMPPGLDPRRRLGPRRARASGVTVDYPVEQAYPRFLLRLADVDLSLGGNNVAAGSYRAKIAGLTTEPALYGGPLQIVAQRSGGRVGPTNVRVFAQLAHARPPLRDSAVASISGLALPVVPVAPLRALVALGDGTTDLTLSRTGNTIRGRWYVRTTRAAWQKMNPDSAAAPTRDRARQAMEDLLWRTISGINEVEIDARLSGSIDNPAFSVQSNIGNVVAQSLKRAVGEQVARAERLVRAKVDSLVGEGRRQVEERVAVLQTGIQERVSQQRGQLEKLKSDLEAGMREKTRIQLPGGVRLPGR